MLLLGLFIGGMGVFRYQEVSHLAREGARYASTHGGMYQQAGLPTSTGVPAISSLNDSNLTTVLQARSVSLNPNYLTVNVDWYLDGTSPPERPSDISSSTPNNYPYCVDPNADPPGSVVYQNNVKVTVTYQWTPELYVIGPITLSSTSVMPMSY
jgi:hypothetical protein